MDGVGGSCGEDHEGVGRPQAHDWSRDEDGRPVRGEARPATDEEVFSGANRDPETGRRSVREQPLTQFQSRFHDWTVASVTFGEVFTIGLIAPTKRPVQLVLHHVLCFRASDLIEVNIVEAASFEPLPELGLTGLRSVFRRFGHPADTEGRAELLFAKYGGYGALSIDAVMGLNAFALCERLEVLDPSGGRS